MALLLSGGREGRDPVSRCLSRWIHAVDRIGGGVGLALHVAKGGKEGFGRGGDKRRQPL